MDLFDILIVGGGPTGLFGAYYAGLRGMRTLIIDPLPNLGGQLTALYPEKYIYDMPGFPRVLARDLAANLVEQGLQYGAETRLEERVETLTSDGETVTAVTGKGTYYAKTALITAGMGAFRPKTHPAPGIEALEGRGIAYHVRDKTAYEGKDVVIVGGGDSALDWALHLHDTADSITLIHRRDAFRAHEETVVACKNAPNVSFKLFRELRAVHGDEWLEAVTVFHNKTDEEETIPTTAVLLCLGFSADLGPIKSWGLDIQKNSVAVNSRMETNIPRVYAAGDITWHDGKLKLIATGVGEATIAVNFAKSAIDPRASVFPGHSSEINDPVRSVAVDTAGTRTE
jgi:thioredoxin reductase (NADPH)